MDDQLNSYREAQKRKYEQTGHTDSQGSFSDSTHEGSRATNQQHAETEHVPLYPHIDTHTQSTHAAPSSVAPSAPPFYEEQEKLEKQQMEDDERMARMLQEQENSERVEEIREPPISARQRRDSDQISDDEQLAKILQEEENASAPPPLPSESHPATTEAPQQPQDRQPAQQEEAPGFWGSIGRGLRAAYDIYQQYQQPQPQPGQQQGQSSQYPGSQGQQQAASQRQIDQDEALARRLQSEENANPVFEVQAPHRSNYPPSFQNYDEMYDDDDLFTQQHIHPQDPLANLRQMNSLFRSMGAPPEHPLLLHLQEMMRQSGHRGGGPGAQMFFMPTGMPMHRYMFPRPVFQQVRGVENLPPELLNVMEGEADASYESLLQLADRIQPVSRGATSQQIDQLPTRTYTEGSMPADQKNCGVCLSDYEAGETLRTLPGCLHSFHKDCIDKWLQINKVCPVCRHEITEITQSPGDN